MSRGLGDVYKRQVINPMEMLRQGRDSTRMREIGTLHRAISMLRINTPAASLGSSNTIHVSIPSDSPTCANLGLPLLLQAGFIAVYLPQT